MNYLLLSQPRTGSLNVCQKLSSHPEIACPHEILLSAVDLDSHFDYVRRITKKPIVVLHGHYAFNVKDTFSHTCKKMLLTRGDYVQAGISRAFMGNTRAEGFTMDMESMDLIIERREQVDAVMRAHADAEVEYANIKDNDLLDFFGATLGPLKSETRPGWKNIAGNEEALYSGRNYVRESKRNNGKQFTLSFPDVMNEDVKAGKTVETQPITIPDNITHIAVIQPRIGLPASGNLAKRQLLINLGKEWENGGRGNLPGGMFNYGVLREPEFFTLNRFSIRKGENRQVKLKFEVLQDCHLRADIDCFAWPLPT